MPSFHSRTGCPLPVSPAASPLTLHCPTLSKQCFRFTLHLIPRRSRHVFRPLCLSSASIQKFLHAPRPRTTFTKLRDRISLQRYYKCTIVVRASSLAVRATCTVRNVHAPLYINSHQTSVVMRLMIGFCVEFLSKTHTSNELRSHAGFDTLSGVFRFRAYSPYSGSFAGFTQLTARSTQR